MHTDNDNYLKLIPEDFWSYSLDVYSNPGIAEVCLHAQDTWGADVNILLLVSWLYKCNLEIEKPGWAQLLVTSNHWQKTYLRPIRTKRMTAKGTAHYESIKREELALEQKAQIALLNAVESHAVVSAEINEDSLLFYCREIGLDDRALIKRLNEQLLQDQH